jgi:hypothetical protein
VALIRRQAQIINEPVSCIKCAPSHTHSHTHIYRNTPLSLLCVALYCHTAAGGSKGWMRLRYLMLALSLAHICSDIRQPQRLRLSRRRRRRRRKSLCLSVNTPERRNTRLYSVRAVGKAVSAVHNNNVSCILCSLCVCVYLLRALSE